MKRELLLMRHGKSDWDTGVDDFRRPLKDRGKRDAQRMGVYLARQNLLPDHIVTSPAERAQTTASKLCKAMGRGDQAIEQDRRIYAAAVDALLAVLGDCPGDAQRVMLVGHNPGLEQLLVWLAGNEVTLPDDGKLLPTATLARLLMPADWQVLTPGCARLQSITRPATLPKKFPYPSPDGSEQRDRPAYYYSQSSVIPYRAGEGKMEILVISSSKNHHLVVPKGIIEPGLSARESAAREALEEAGIEGEVADTAIGTYSYKKWGATCNVEVYPMRVRRMIDEDDWAERHRGRQWMNPQKAAAKLKQKELGPLVSKLESML